MQTVVGVEHYLRALFQTAPNLHAVIPHLANLQVAEAGASVLDDIYGPRIVIAKQRGDWDRENGVRMPDLEFCFHTKTIAQGRPAFDIPQRDHDEHALLLHAQGRDLSETAWFDRLDRALERHVSTPAQHAHRSTRGYPHGIRGQRFDDDLQNLRVPELKERLTGAHGAFAFHEAPDDTSVDGGK